MRPYAAEKVGQDHEAAAMSQAAISGYCAMYFSSGILKSGHVKMIVFTWRVLHQLRHDTPGQSEVVSFGSFMVNMMIDDGSNMSKTMVDDD